MGVFSRPPTKIHAATITMCLIRGGLLFGGILVLLSLISVEAGMLMGKGLGMPGTSQGRRPWEKFVHGRPYGKGRHYNLEDTDDHKYYRKPSMYEMYGDPSPRRSSACVGACYYEKLLGLNSKSQAEKIPNETIQDEIVHEEPSSNFEPAPEQVMPISASAVAEKSVKKEPCVGICQYYRSLGLENPYEKRAKQLMV